MFARIQGWAASGAQQLSGGVGLLANAGVQQAAAAVDMQPAVEVLAVAAPQAVPPPVVVDRAQLGRVDEDLRRKRLALADKQRTREVWNAARFVSVVLTLGALVAANNVFFGLPLALAGGMISIWAHRTVERIEAEIRGLERDIDLLQGRREGLLQAQLVAVTLPQAPAPAAAAVPRRPQPPAPAPAPAVGAAVAAAAPAAVPPPPAVGPGELP